MKLPRILLLGVLATPLSALATVWTFDLQGQAGFGLLSGNETGTINGTPGSGGEIGDGIWFDDVTSTLSISVGWGSGNGFTDLSGTASAGHVHIITSGSGFTGTGGPVINFATLPSFTFDTSASSGFVTGTAVLDSTNETALFNNGLYINIHTALNGGGEIRGNLVNATAVPEPATWAMLAGVAALAGAVWQRRRSRLG